MKTNLIKLIVGTGLALGVAAAAPAEARKKQITVEAPLNEQGEKLEDKYSKTLKTLEETLLKRIPQVRASQKEAFLQAVQKEDEAVLQIKEAEKGMAEYTRAQALVKHATGKWIGGAQRGIKLAEAKLGKAKTPAERKAAQEELAKWKQNLKEGQEALKERQARLKEAEKKQPAVKEEMRKAGEALARAKEQTLEALAKLGLNSALENDKLDAALAKYVVLKEATPHGLAAFAQISDENQELIDEMLASEELLIEMLVADGAKKGRYGEAMEIFQSIKEVSDKAADGPLRRLALAIALEHAVPITQRNAKAAENAPEFVDPVGRYLHYEKAFLAGELDPAFKHLTIWDYRMVVDGNEPDDILAWGRKMLRNYRPDHITTDDYRWRYVAIVRSDIRYGSEDNKYDKPELQFFQNILMNGGICGRRAFFGRFILRAFGIPTTARPQRGHAALTHWTPEGWVVCLGAGWGSGWTKGRYDRDLDFLATTQARAAGNPFMKVKRAQWMGDLLDEPRVYGILSQKTPEFWYGVSLYLQKRVIAKADAKVLAAVGTDIGEANETKEKVEIAKVEVTEEDRKISIDKEGAITIPAAATSKPTKSTGKILFLNSVLGGKQLHYSRTGNHQSFEYRFEVPEAGKYQLTGRLVTPSWRQNLLLAVNGAEDRTEMPLPFTVGMWDETEPVTVELKEGLNVLNFKREGEVKGVSIKSFTLTPVSMEVSQR